MLKKENSAQKIWHKQPSDPLSLLALGQKHLQWMQTKNYAPKTIEARRYYLGYFLDWCDTQEITMPHQVSKNIIEQYQEYLLSLVSPMTKEIFSVDNRSRLLSSLRCFFSWLTRKHYIFHNPVEQMKFPKKNRTLPRLIIPFKKIEQIINKPDISNLLGIRDRAILETFYSSGIRRQELTNLLISDVDLKKGTLVVNQGKGMKDRVVPLGKRGR